MQEIFIGVISDTHGLMRQEALNAFKGAHLILHAGDIGRPEVIQSLKEVAHVIAVRGNCDRGRWADEYPKTEVVEIGDMFLYLIHDINELDINPKSSGFNAVISGHSHKPSMIRRDGVLFLNPGSAGPKRFNLPVSAAQMRVGGASIDVKFLDFSPASFTKSS